MIKLASKYITKNELISYINDTTFYKEDAEIINNMINNMDSRLFVKVVEEIMLGNLYWSDFKPIYNDDKFSTVISDSIKSQSEFNERLQQFISYHNNINNSVFDTLVNTNSKVISIEKRNKIYSLLLSENKNPIDQYYTNKMIDYLLEDDSDENDRILDMLLSADEYVVPVSWEDIEVNDVDLAYCSSNNIKIDDFKKTKSLALYLDNLNEKKKKDSD